MRSIVYHQHEVLYIIKPQERYTLARDEIQPKGLMIYAALRASMIYQACGLDKKSESFRFRIFGWGSWIRTSENARVKVWCLTAWLYPNI